MRAALNVIFGSLILIMVTMIAGPWGFVFGLVVLFASVFSLNQKYKKERHEELLKALKKSELA